MEYAPYFYLAGSFLLGIASYQAVKMASTLINRLYLVASILFVIGGCFMVFG